VEALRPAGTDEEGRVQAGAARARLQTALLERLRPDSDSSPVTVDLPTFTSLMADRAVQEFAAGDKALLPAFEAIDEQGIGRISQAQFIRTVESFCSAVPDAEGCDISNRPFFLGQAFDAFANGEKLLDYEQFVQMLSGRSSGEECALPAEARHSRPPIDEMMGERECFGEATHGDGEDDLACDAWFYGEDPTEKRTAEVDHEKLAKLKAAGQELIAQRKQVQERMQRAGELRVTQLKSR